MFGLSAADWSMLESLAIRPLKAEGARVWIFGSRARGDSRPFSDVDLLFEVQEPLSSGLLSKIREDMEESRLPVKVDLVNIRTLADGYRESVLAERIPV